MKRRSLLPSLFENHPAMSMGFGGLRKDIDKLFEEFGRDFGTPAMFGSGAATGFDLVPSMDVHEGDKDVTLTFELPGVEEKDIDISVTGRMISVSGEKKSETESKKGEPYHVERSYGSFKRSLSLPFDIDGDKVKADFDKGVLTVTVGKPAEAVTSTKKVPIGK